MCFHFNFTSGDIKVLFRTAKKSICAFLFTFSIIHLKRKRLTKGKYLRFVQPKSLVPVLPTMFFNWDLKDSEAGTSLNSVMRAVNSPINNLSCEKTNNPSF
jgi:hypothetical protein